MSESARDEALMAEVAKGKYEALEALIRRHATPLLSFLHRMTGDYHHGEELFQEVFLAVWCKRDLYEYPRPFKTWLYAIAVNRCRSDFRRASPATESLTGDLPERLSGRSSPVTTAMAAERTAIIAAAVARLPESQRAVVVLRIWQQMSYTEISQVLDVPDATVRSHMHRGLCRLRELLEGQLGEES